MKCILKFNIKNNKFLVFKRDGFRASTDQIKRLT